VVEEDALELFKKYDDCDKWIKNFDVYEKGLDLDTDNQKEKLDELYNYIENKYHRLDHVIICAAQTIRVREKERIKTKTI